MSQILEDVKRERMSSLTVNSTTVIAVPHGVLPFGCSLYDQHKVLRHLVLTATLVMEVIMSLLLSSKKP